MKKNIVLSLLFCLVCLLTVSGQTVLTPNQSGSIGITSHCYYTVTPDQYGNMVNKSSLHKIQTHITINTQQKTVKVSRNNNTVTYKIVRIISGNGNPALRCVEKNSNNGCYINVNPVFGIENLGDVWIKYDNDIDIHYLFILN